MQQNLSMVLDGILQMSYRSCVEGLGVYKKASEQAVRLGEFYQWCREMGYCAPYEYPFVEKIPAIQVVMLEAFVEQMWRTTEDEDEASSETMVEERGRDMQVVVSFEWEKFEEEEVVKPLIEVEDDDRSWEVELEDSVKLIWNREVGEKMRDEKSLQLFSPDLFNPFFW
ncbi:uncharacterized protein A4U43_C07F35960 [Asparagus officinalis]|uniref:AP180 N-terminal homology (ANTH) domain-containing protein n=1 Tax=Asparagus officinalis TaxID=4686 RepID=A0A5P1EHC0_ASPOF|nr:uncharacterized protein A4U43_C07F35960 [Asparagus officinalis]